MPNAKDNALILDDISILVVGESGTGKSVFASTFPTPMFVFDFDKQIAAYGNKDIDYEQYEKSNAGWMKYEKDHADFLNGTICNKRQFKAVVIDSTSTLIDLAMERALALSPKRGAVGEPLWEVHYKMVSFLVDGKIKQLLNWKGYKVIICHVRADKDEVTGAINYMPYLPGALGIKLPVNFGEVYYSKIRNNPKLPFGREYVLQTLGNMMYKARSNMSGVQHYLPEEVPNDFSKILEIMKTKQSKV